MSSLDEINKYIDDGDYKRAIEELDLIISKEPDNARAFYMRGKSAFIGLQHEEFDNTKYDARRALIYSTIEYDLSKSIDIDPDIIDAYRGLMYLNRELKNINKEREYAQILFEKDSSAYDALLILASSYLNNGENEADFHQAIGYYDDFISNVEDNRIARFERGLCYYNLNILPKADIEANSLIYDYPFYDDAYFLKGIILAKRGSNSGFYDDAIFFFDRAVEINNKNYNSIYERAEWYFNKGNYRKAIENYNELLKTNNKYRLNALLGKIQALHDLIIENEDKYYPDSQEEGKDLKEVFYLLDKVIDVLGINSLQYRYYRANLYSYQGEIRKAISEFKKILNENQESWIYEKIAELYHNYAQSDDDYREALKYLSHIDKSEYKHSTFYILIFSNYELKNYETTAELCKEFFEYTHEDDEEIYYIKFIYADSLQMIGSKDYELILQNLKSCLNSQLDKATIYRSIAEILLYNMPSQYNDEGIYMLKKAIGLNDALSYFIYAKELFYGDIIDPYPELAIGIANMAFDIDNTLECALIVMGKGHELGRGIERDDKKAFEIYCKAKEIADKNNSKCSCASGLVAHCYYNGIGVEKDENKAFEIVKDIAKKKGRDSHDHIALLYSYFALKNIEGFDLKEALILFENADYNNLYIVMTLKRIYKRLGFHYDAKRMSKMENKAMELVGELNMSYLRKYIRKFNDFYPILNIIL
ncbi:tetratricopeptide repeat protein [Brachyspira pulli]|uniref:tetratricopeptide repeat protein n=1 Tax=Brachyspira pulli TaxID=310721 RepID=UPI0030045DB1